jgi:membrane protein DedA with SNARE-associated domain
MPWRKFTLYNVLGGTAWATAAVSLGYFLWASVGTVKHWAGWSSLLLVAVVVLLALLLWVYRKSHANQGSEDLPDKDEQASYGEPR